MVFENTPVSGLHPYQGGSLSLTFVLYRVRRQNNADRLLRVLEGLSSAVDPSHTLSMYIRIANAVMDGIEVLLG